MNSVILEKTNVKKWYREPYVWFLILFPFIAVTGGIYTAWLAYKTSDGLVVDDYYVRGLEINRDLDRDRAADSYALQASLKINDPEGMLTINLSGNKKFILPEMINVTFIHATRSGFDHALVIRKDPDSVYKTSMPPLIRGKWHVLIEAGNWRRFVTYIVK